MAQEKVTESLRLHLTEGEMLDLTRMASMEDRTLSDFLRCLVIRPYLYGSVRRAVMPVQLSKSADQFSEI